MSSDYLGLDLGTGTLKGVRWNPEQGVTVHAKRSVELLHPHEKWTEIDPEQYFMTVLSLLHELAEDSSHIEAVAFAAASGNTLLCEGHGKALTPVISWLDQRSGWMPPEAWKVFEVTGWPRMNMFSLAHLEWFRSSQPELLKDAYFAMSNDWVAWRLTGCHKIDHSSAVPSQMMDRHTLRWSPEYLKYYGLTAERVPELVASGSLIGNFREEYCSGGLSGKTRLMTGSFDHPAAARAIGVTRPGEMLLSCGTSWVGFQPVPPESVIREGELFDPFQSAAGGSAAKMFSFAGVGLEIDEYVKAHYGTGPDVYDKFNEDPAALPVMRNIVEKVCARIRESEPERIVMTGGPSEGRTWRRLLKEALPQMEFSELQSFAGAAGAAMLAQGEIQ